MPKNRILLRLCLLVALICSTAPASLAQATYGNIIGTVTDPAGAVVPGAQVKAVNTGTNISSIVRTNPSGNYELTQLLPGTYNVTFSKEGFQNFVQENVTVAVGQSSPLSVVLQLGSVEQKVTVTAAPPLLQTDRAEVSTRLTSQVIENLPILNRNFTDIELLLPGNVKNAWQHPLNENPASDILVNTNGQMYAGDNFMIDGASNNDAVLGIIAVNPAMDSI